MTKQELLPVAIVDDDRAYSESISELLGRSGRFECVAVCDSAEVALQELPRVRPRIVLMDIQMPGMCGPECVGLLKDKLPDAEILMLTVFEEYERIFESLVAGATGYLLKRTPHAELFDAIEDLHRGGSPMSSAIARKVVQAFRANPPDRLDTLNLSKREVQILRAFAHGRRYKEIAKELDITYDTVRTHIQNTYKKLQINSRKEARQRLRGD